MTGKEMQTFLAEVVKDATAKLPKGHMSQMLEAGCHIDDVFDSFLDRCFCRRMGAGL